MGVEENMEINLSELIMTLYDEYLAIFKNEDLAAVAVAATINDLLDAQDDVLPPLPGRPDAHPF